MGGAPPPPQRRATLTASSRGPAGEALLLVGGLSERKLELAERGSTRTGLKAVLQRRLHGLIVQAAIERRASEMDI